MNQFQFFLRLYLCAENISFFEEYNKKKVHVPYTNRTLRVNIITGLVFAIILIQNKFPQQFEWLWAIFVFCVLYDINLKFRSISYSNEEDVPGFMKLKFSQKISLDGVQILFIGVIGCFKFKDWIFGFVG